MNKSSGMSRDNGSILLYVLWILVVISLLAFQLSSISRTLMINRVSETSQIKKRLQLHSATQFAIFKINANSWKNEKYELKLNDQNISIQIFNEAGFFSVYDMRNQSLKNIFESVSMPQSLIDEMSDNIDDEEFSKFNDFNEIRLFEGVTEEIIHELIPYVSIYHEESINPVVAPEEVLLKVSGIDLYRVDKLMETTDVTKKRQLRAEIMDILQSQNKEVSESMSPYYRVHISLGSELYRVFINHSPDNEDFLVVNTILPLSPRI